MSEDPIRKYSDATKEFSKIKSRVREYGLITADVSRYLSNKPYKLGISNVSANLPLEMTMAEKEYTLNANDWPSAKQIAEALASLYEKRKQLELIWSSLSQTDKALVNPPDTK
jgi:hypothetical protein